MAQTTTDPRQQSPPKELQADELAPLVEGGELDQPSIERLTEALKLIPRWPFLIGVSGRYESYGRVIPPWRILPRPGRVERDFAEPLAETAIEEEDGTALDVELMPEEEEREALIPIPFPYARESLNLDVDGWHPQMTASGTLRSGLRTRIDWIAKIVRIGSNRYRGRIWYKDGAVASFPYTQVDIRVNRTFHPWARRATVRFSVGGGLPARTRSFRYTDRAFRHVNFEFDCADGTTAVTSIQTHAHPNRPATLPGETLTIEKVFERAGCSVQVDNTSTVPLSYSGTNHRWSDLEMHDAMQVYWSKFADKPQWAMWVFFASLHEMGTSLGGIMFDDIGPNHRQGTAIFEDSFINNAPAGETHPNAWVRRMKFWTACHEMGHAFNLAHSWQKELGAPWHPSVQNEAQARSFMNYPYFVTGGQSAFFSDFEYRFSDQELLFMRHTPERFVQMGNADWFDHHAFEQAETTAQPTYELSLRVNRDRPVYEFLEPVNVELKLKNVSSDPHLVPSHLLEDFERVTFIIKRRGRPARQFVPFAQYCYRGEQQALMPGNALYSAAFIAAGRNGWDLSEPGYYTLHAAVRVNGEDVVSNRLELRITPPAGYDDELIAQDFFSEAVGRILSFNGSNELDRGNDTLRETADRLADRRVALHARMVLANAKARPCKRLQFESEPAVLCAAHEAGASIEETKAEPEFARSGLYDALADDMSAAADTFGHITLNTMAKRFTDWLAEHDDAGQAVSVTEKLENVLEKRGVLKSVIDEIGQRKDKYRKNAKK